MWSAALSALPVPSYCGRIAWLWLTSLPIGHTLQPMHAGLCSFYLLVHNGLFSSLLQLDVFLTHHHHTHHVGQATALSGHACGLAKSMLPANLATAYCKLQRQQSQLTSLLSILSAAQGSFVTQNQNPSNPKGFEGPQSTSSPSCTCITNHFFL